MSSRRVVSARDLIADLEDEQEVTPTFFPPRQSASRPSVSDWLKSFSPAPVQKTIKSVGSPRSTSPTDSSPIDGSKELNFAEASTHGDGVTKKEKPSASEKKKSKDDKLSDEDQDVELGDQDYDWMVGDSWPKLVRTPFTSKEEPLILSTDPLVKVPAHIAKYLRAYQQEGVQWLYDQYKEGKGGILADDMGLGKTVQVAAFLIAIFGKSATSKDVTPPSYLEACPATKRALIVCPASISHQWKAELLTWSFFHIKFLAGPTKDLVLNAARQGHTEILISSYESYRTHSDAINAMDWTCAIFDEAHRIKELNGRLSQAARGLRTRVRFGLTGTLIQNNMMELWCTMDWAVPNCLGDDSMFRREFQTPISMGQKRNAAPAALDRARRLAKRLAALIARHALRREKSLIADQFPGKQDLICVCPMAPRQTEIYQRVLAHPDYAMLRDHALPCECGAFKGGRAKKRSECCHKYITQDEVKLFKLGSPEARWSEILFPAITQLLKICNHIDLIRFSHSDPPEKKICNHIDLIHSGPAEKQVTFCSCCRCKRAVK